MFNADDMTALVQLIGLPSNKRQAIIYIYLTTIRSIKCSYLAKLQHNSQYYTQVFFFSLIKFIVLL